MKITEKIDEIRNIVSEWSGRSSVDCPDDGVPHEGHKSLIGAVSSNDRVIVRFCEPDAVRSDGGSGQLSGSRSDEKSRERGADVIFHPPSEMYNDDFSSVDMTTHRRALRQDAPIHFRGVCTVITKPLNITTPDRAYRQKDAQQLAVIMHMVSDLNLILRSSAARASAKRWPAKSSRNTYLSANERAAATILSKALGEGRMLGSAVTGQPCYC